MKVVIANDHRGLKLKNYIIKNLTNNNYTVENLGTDKTDSVDYPNIAFSLGNEITKDKQSLGILICGTGIGMSIAANKVKGVRCAKVSTVNEARLAREHNNANVIAISAGTSLFKTKKIINTFLETNFSNEQRHIKRVDLINKYESRTNA